jgi:hypothetical protein
MLQPVGVADDVAAGGNDLRGGSGPECSFREAVVGGEVITIRDAADAGRVVFGDVLAGS